MKNKLLSNRYVIVSFFVCFLICYVYTFSRHVKLCYDSVYYASIANGVVNRTGIHLSNYPKTFRGVLFPIFLQITSKVGIDWDFSASLFSAGLFAVILPYLINKSAITSIRQIVGTGIALSLFIYIWGDLLVYPLSDLVAVFFMASAIAVAKALINYIERTTSYSILHITIASFVIGMTAYIAYNTRVTYLYGVLILLFVLFFVLIKNIVRISEYRSYWYKLSATTILFFLLGAGISMVPQCIVNMYCEGKFSPRVFTENVDEGDTNLQMQQVAWGIMYQRYETYIGDDSEYPKPSVFFVDEAGKELILRNGISSDHFTIRQFFGLLRRYPIDMLCIYMRHLVNAMTPLWKHIYIPYMYTSKIRIILLSIGIWLICLIALKISVFSISKDFKSHYFLIETGLLLSLVLPALFQILGAVETRFFLPVYLLSYSYAGVGINYSQLFRAVKKNAMLVVFVSMLIMLLWITVISNTLSCNLENDLLISDSFRFYN